MDGAVCWDAALGQPLSAWGGGGFCGHILWLEPGSALGGCKGRARLSSAPTPRGSGEQILGDV